MGGNITYRGAPITVQDRFPLSIDASGRYFNDAQNQPFFLFGDTAWTINVQLTREQVDRYLNDRQSRGFTCILLGLIEKAFSSQTPVYDNAYGEQPFTTMSPVSWTSRVEAYWTHIDYIINALKTREMVAIAFPAYLGFGGGSEGWMADVTAASAGDLQNYGTFLANRYGQGNIIWCAGGDFAGDTTQRDKQANIFSAIKAVQTNALMTGHPARTDSDGYTYWGAGGQNYSWFNVNSVYTNFDTVVAEANTSFGRSPAMPSIMLESAYENTTYTTNYTVQQAFQCVLSGSMHVTGNEHIWPFAGPTDNGLGPEWALDNALSTPGVNAVCNLHSVLVARAWHLLEPKTDTSVVTTALGSADSATVAARASDGSFALVGKNNSSSITIDKTCITHTPFTAKWFDPTNSVFMTPAEGLSHTNTGTQAFAHPGANSIGSTAWVLVLE